MEEDVISDMDVATDFGVCMPKFSSSILVMDSMDAAECPLALLC